MIQRDIQNTGKYCFKVFEYCCLDSRWDDFDGILWKFLLLKCEIIFGKLFLSHIKGLAKVNVGVIEKRKQSAQ